MRATLEGFRSEERQGPEGSIETEQWVEAPHPVVASTKQGGRALGGSYWLEVARGGHGLVRGLESADGVTLSLLALRPALLRLGPAEVGIDGDRVGCRYPILGGLLAKRPGGALTVSQSGREQPELRVAVHGFFPRLEPRARSRWNGALYRMLQRRLHVAISRRWFRRLIEEGVR
jgi:hypothetical protein